MDDIKLARNDAPNYWQRFRTLFIKWWLIIFAVRALLIRLTRFGSFLLIPDLITLWFSAIVILLTPELEIAVKIVGGMAFYFWQVVFFSLFLIAVTSAMPVALVVSIAAFETRDSR